MASVKPVVSNSQALITPGWPMASVQHSNPAAPVEDAEVKATPASAHVTVVRGKALTQSGHVADRID